VLLVLLDPDYSIHTFQQQEVKTPIAIGMQGAYSTVSWEKDRSQQKRLRNCEQIDSVGTTMII
jgi:hypothetical protein